MSQHFRNNFSFMSQQFRNIFVHIKLITVIGVDENVLVDRCVK